MKFRKIPVVIDAVQWDGFNVREIEEFITCDFTFDMAHRILEIHTLEGVMQGLVGDWIIKGVKGEFYPCKPDIFEVTYEKVEDRQKGPQDYICDHCGQYSPFCKC